MILIPPASISRIQRTANPAALNRSLNHVSLRFARLSPNPLILFSSPPWRPWREGLGFTLIELMAATTVLSVILLMMVGMQDQMSKAWANANRRTDATREARSAAILMAADLTCPIFRSPTNKSKKDQFADSLINKGLPFVYSSNGTGSGLSISNIQSGSSCLFFVTPKKITSTNNSSDLALVGYYVGQTNSPNINGFKTTNLNLYRYYVPNPSTRLSTWFANPTSASLNSLFTAIEANSEILARNVANLQILFYNEGTNPIEGMNYANTTSMGTIYRGNKIQVSLTLYPEDAAQKFTSLNSWTDSNNITKFSRSFEFRVDCWRD
jgi:prepilin-type N-terminal cleavage/methylation domain-containing protein